MFRVNCRGRERWRQGDGLGGYSRNLGKRRWRLEPGPCFKMVTVEAEAIIRLWGEGEGRDGDREVLNLDTGNADGTVNVSVTVPSLSPEAILCPLCARAVFPSG